MSTQFDLCDVWLPADVVRAIVDEDISRPELKVLFVVRALTIKKRWCWPSNEYLASVGERSQPTYISSCISTLVDKGFLKRKFKGDKRYLRLAWSWNLPKGALRKIVRPLTKNRKPALRKIVTDRKEQRGERTERGKNSDFSRRGGDSKTNRREEDRQHVTVLVQLKKATVAAGRAWKTKKGDVRDLRRLEKFPNYRRWVDIYCKHVGETGWPCPANGQQFVKNVENNWIPNMCAKSTQPSVNGKLRDDQII